MDEESSPEQEELETLRLENEQLKRTLQEQRQAERTRQLEEAVCRALTERGAMPQAVPLLLRQVLLEDAGLGEDGSLLNADELLREVTERFADFFVRIRDEGTPPVHPPGSGAAVIARDSLRGMTAEEINRDWPIVREALGGR